jgi:hypothetical protein
MLRDFMLTKTPPGNFKTAYEYVRAMFDAVDANDPKPPNPKVLDLNWCHYVDGREFYRQSF